MRNLIILLTGLTMLLFQNCAYVDADVPDQLAVTVEFLELEAIAGTCFDENLNREDFIQCLGADLERAGYITETP